jgi:hypothetical protein
MIEVNGRNEATVLISHARHDVLAVSHRPMGQNTMLLCTSCAFQLKLVYPNPNPNESARSLKQQTTDLD